MRDELERLASGSPNHATLSALYDQSTEEIDERARKAWSRGKIGAPAMNDSAAAQATISHLPAKAARVAAVEVLLADPEALGDDVLESALYILRERLLETE